MKRAPNTAQQQYDATRLAVVAWLASLRWDGVPRLHYAAAQIVGGDLDAWRVVSSLIITACVRALRPGTHDAPVAALIGPQGTGKNLLLGALFGEWHTQRMGRIDASSLPLSWCHELDDARTASIEALVAAHTLNIRRRKSQTATVSRWWVLALTSNAAAEIKSQRFDVACIQAPINVELACVLRDQLFAEAYATVNATLATTPADYNPEAP